jgi:ankyrin repeat protein
MRVMFQMWSMSKQSIVRKLLSACECGDMPLVLYLLDISYADVNCSSQGSTPLHTALSQKHTKLAISLINMPGININQTDQDNSTPLHLA